MSFDQPVPDRDVGAVETSLHQLAHPKTADNMVKHPFQLVIVDLIGPSAPEVLGGYKYVSRNSDEHTKWKETYLLISKHDALSSLQPLVHNVVIPSGFCARRLAADTGGGLIGKRTRQYRLERGLSLEYASAKTPKNRHLVCPSAFEEPSWL